MLLRDFASSPHSIQGIGIMNINPDFVAPCGLYCGVCAIYIAHRDENRKFKERLAAFYKGEVTGKGDLPNNENLSTEDIRCKGCLSDELFMHCRQCEIRACTKEKGYTGCHQCDEFPCRHIEDFPWLLARRLCCGRFRIGGSLVLKNGLKMKKPVIFVRNAATKCFEAL